MLNRSIILYVTFSPSPHWRCDQDEANEQAPIQRIVDDTERRLNILFDGLNNETVPKSAVDKMHEIARGESLFPFPPSPLSASFLSHSHVDIVSDPTASESKLTNSNQQ